MFKRIWIPKLSLCSALWMGQQHHMGRNSPFETCWHRSLLSAPEKPRFCMAFVIYMFLYNVSRRLKIFCLSKLSNINLTNLLCCAEQKHSKERPDFGLRLAGEGPSLSHNLLSGHIELLKTQLRYNWSFWVPSLSALLSLFKTHIYSKTTDGWQIYRLLLLIQACQGFGTSC